MVVLKSIFLVVVTATILFAPIAVAFRRGDANRWWYVIAMIMVPIISVPILRLVVFLPGPRYSSRVSESNGSQECQSCHGRYNETDYRPDAPEWRCGICRARLPRARPSESHNSMSPGPIPRLVRSSSSPDDHANPEPPKAPLRHERESSFARDHNDFAITFYGQLRRGAGNLFFSPFSIRAALGMTFAGARGETATQMSGALRFAGSEESVHSAFGEVIERLNVAGGSSYEMAVANSLWGQEGESLQPGFLDLVAQHYGGGMNLVDFRRGAEAARMTINQWVEAKTREKIRNLIPSGGLDAETRLILVNAIYFKGLWLLSFGEASTSVDYFYLEDGGQVRAPLMYQRAEVRYAEAVGFQAVDLSYRGGDLSMLVLLPDKEDGLRDLEGTVSASMLQQCVASMQQREVKLYLPRFKITWGTFGINDQLIALGMPLAFNRDQADFSGINSHAPPDERALFISAILHKAFVEVTEDGTEAAAATAVVMAPLAAMRPPSQPLPVPVFRADHPFLFAIRDRKSGLILFLGRMVNPTEES